VAEQIEMGLDSKPGLTEINENRNEEDGIGLEIEETNLVVLHDILEKGMQA
jgi:hypothetical protein